MSPSWLAGSPALPASQPSWRPGGRVRQLAATRQAAAGSHFRRTDSSRPFVGDMSNMGGWGWAGRTPMTEDSGDCPILVMGEYQHYIDPRLDSLECRQRLYNTFT